MNGSISEVASSEKGIQGLTLNVEDLSETNFVTDQDQKSPKDMVWKQISRKSNNSPFPTVRKMIEVVNTQKSPQSPTNSQHQQGHSASNSRLISLHLSQSIKGSRKKKLKDISKLISLKKDVIEKVERTAKEYEQKNLKQSISTLIDDIYSARSGKAFFSQPHYSKNKSNSVGNNSNTMKLLTKSKENNPQNGSETKYVMIPGNYNTIQSSRTSSEHYAYQKKPASKVKQEMNKIQAEKGYINTIWQLGINKKSQSEKKSLYHTIDPNKTQKWFEIAQNSRRKLTHLFKEKNKLQEQKNDQFIKSRKNQYVEKLLEKSSKEYQTFTNEVKQITKAKHQAKSLILREKRQPNQPGYKVQSKQYFRIQINKQSPSISKDKESSLDGISQLLPQIKTNSKP